MSSALTKARTQLNSVGTSLKQGKLLVAANAIYEATGAILRNPLMKSEKDEFSTLLEHVVFQLSSDQKLKSIYPIKITYTAGQEKELLAAIKGLLSELRTNVADEAKEQLAALERKKLEGLATGQKHLDNQEYDAARQFFDSLVNEFKNDTDFRADIAERFIKAGRYKDAFDYLDQAIQDDPKAVHLYNRIGIVLRKMQDFDTAEKYYKRALAMVDSDDNLYFNLGRLYVDWGKWDKVAEAATEALRINPEFAEAMKMQQFALKKLK